MKANASCWFAELPNAGPCDGKLVKCHLVTKQTLRKDVWANRTREALVASGVPLPKTRQQLFNDPRAWVYGCGGPIGQGGHHGQYKPDGPRPIARHLLPPEVEEFARELRIVWWLDRTYGT